VSIATLAPPLRVRVPEDPQVAVAFSRRPGPGERTGAGNVSLLVGEEAGRPGAVLEARALLTAAVGLDLDDLVVGTQVHGADVARVGRAQAGRGARDAGSALPGVDALVTAEAGVGLAVLAADCIPLALVDPGRAVAAVHAGRAGLEAGVVPAALAALREAGAATGRPELGVVALIGPAIGGCCYEVEAELAARVARRVPGAAATTRWGTPALDLPAGAQAQLHAAGVERVEHVGGCTGCGGGPWFSARAAAGHLPARPSVGRPAAGLREARGPVGRHATVVARTADPSAVAHRGTA